MPEKRYKLYITLLVIIAMIAALVVWLGRAKPVEVIVKTVSTGTVQETVANTRAGTIKACRRAGISPSIGGQISSLPVKEGDRVEKGQVLMELWNEDVMSQYELATSEAKRHHTLERPPPRRLDYQRRQRVVGLLVLDDR